MKQNSTMQVQASSPTSNTQPTNLLTYAPNQLTDSQLYRQCKYYGSQAKGWMRKFESLLPEVYRRRLYRRRGFAGIHEFAQKLAGMNRDKVDTILRLFLRLEDKPALRSLFESGEIGYSKIEKVVYLATQETDVLWAHRAQTQTQLQLEKTVRRERSNREETALKSSLQPEKITVQETLLNKSADEPENVSQSRESVSKVSFNMRPETEQKLRALQHELEKSRGEAISLGETIEILINREHEKLIEKAQRKKTANYCPDCVKKRADEAANRSEITRAIPAEIRHTVLARQDYLCAGVVDEEFSGESGAIYAEYQRIKGMKCTHPPTELHHLDGWALTKTHNPDRLQYLCKKHHAETHAGDPRVQVYR